MAEGSTFGFRIGDISSRTRALSQSMAPTSAVLGGLVPALERLCDSLSRAYPLLQCELQVPAPVTGRAGDSGGVRAHD